MPTVVNILEKTLHQVVLHNQQSDIMLFFFAIMLLVEDAALRKNKNIVKIKLFTIQPNLATSIHCKKKK